MPRPSCCPPESPALSKPERFKDESQHVEYAVLLLPAWIFFPQCDGHTKERQRYPVCGAYEALRFNT